MSPSPSKAIANSSYNSDACGGMPLKYYIKDGMMAALQGALSGYVVALVVNSSITTTVSAFTIWQVAEKIFLRFLQNVAPRKALASPLYQIGIIATSTYIGINVLQKLVILSPALFLLIVILKIKQIVKIIY